MDKQKPGREFIHLLSRHSNWKETSVRKAFYENGVYAGRSTWVRFIHVLLLGLGASFTISGVLFFFAYNWADMSNFLKLGLIELLIVSCLLFVWSGKFSQLARNIALAAASVLVGVLFAVYGQIYQTGADAYDLFLVWTMAIFLWTLFSNFPPLWLIFMIVLHTTVILYFVQVKSHANLGDLCMPLFLLNATVTVLLEALFHFKIMPKRSSWFIDVLLLASTVFFTIGTVFEIFADEGARMPAMLFIPGVMLYAAGFTFGLIRKNIFYISTICFSLIVIVAALLIKPYKSVGDSIGLFFITSVFIIGSTSVLIYFVLQLNRSKNELE